MAERVAERSAWAITTVVIWVAGPRMNRWQACLRRSGVPSINARLHCTRISIRTCAERKVETDALLKLRFACRGINPGRAPDFGYSRTGFLLTRICWSDPKFQVRRLTTRQLNISRELGAFFASKAFGDSVALTFESEARGRSSCPPGALPKTRLRPRA